MKRKALIISGIFFCLVCSAFGQTELKHGLIIGGGSGSCYDAKLSPYYDHFTKKLINCEKVNATYKYNAFIGYKFRINPVKTPFFYDIDLGIGTKVCKYSSHPIEGSDDGSVSGNNIIYNFSVNPSFNYNIYRKLYVGVGIEPSI